MNLRFSIIIPIYNVEDYLAECLQSVWDQTFDCWEAILVDDGSTDSSLEIARHFVEKDPRFQLISQQNAGLSAARNRGLKQAKGNYVLFLDSDDRIKINSLEKFYKVLSEVAGIDILRGNYIMFHSENHSQSYRDLFDDLGVGDQSEKMTGFSFLGLIGKNRFDPSACRMLYRRLFLLENHLFFTEGILYEDLDVTCRMIAAAKGIIKTGFIFYEYRIRKNSIMRGSTSSRSLYSVISIFKRNYQYLKQHSCQKEIIPVFVGLLSRDLILGFRNSAKLNRSSLFLLKAMKLILRKYKSSNRDYRNLKWINWIGYRNFSGLMRVRACFFSFLKI